MIALADENDDGKISWEEFVPVGIESIKTFFARNAVLQKKKELETQVDEAAMKLIYMDEIKKSDEILQKVFKKIDEKESGTITVAQLKETLKSTCLLTPKEINGMIRTLGNEDFKYEEFSERLFVVRYELARSRILDTNMDKIQNYVV